MTVQTRLALNGPHLIVHFLATRRWPLGDEKKLQDAIEAELIGVGADFRREVKLGHGSVIDFMFGTIACEGKIKGSKRGIYHQCERYCSFPAVSALILATNFAMGFPAMIRGKPCWVAQLGRGWL